MNTNLNYKTEGEEWPWFKYYGKVPPSINYPDKTMAELLFSTSRAYPGHIAYDFMGTSSTYEKLSDDVRACAKALRSLGIGENDKVTICLPNCPHAVIMFYAVNVIGAIANMIHPLSSEGEIEFYLKDSGSVAAITLDAFYGKFKELIPRTSVRRMIIGSMGDYLGAVKKIGFKLTLGRNIAPIPSTEKIIRWSELMALGRSYHGDYAARRRSTDPAVILYSGGTTGTTKGILLSSMNLNATAIQTVTAGDPDLKPGNTMLTVLPMFHGFGLCICLHAMIISGCRCLLVPRFTPETYAQLVRKKKPNYIAGVPTLFEALLRERALDGADLSCLRGVFAGGDSLSADLKRRFDAFLKSHKATVTIREGYGTTECVTASCLTPLTEYREGSIGIPHPDMIYKICDHDTNAELPYGSEGEICICGPSVMLEYVNQPAETAGTLRLHDDGRTWLHTGDLGAMDEDGFIYFRQRLKRMIVSSGYNIYPSQIENVLDSHPYVSMSCVIGVPDPLKIQKVKAFVVLMPGVSADGVTRNELFAHLKKNVAKYALPYDLEFRESLPLTLVGKVAYIKLENEEKEKMAAGKGA